MIYMDSETCGLHGVPVIFQFAEDDGPVHIHDIWRSPAWTTLELIERFTESDFCGFNVAFDWFHICKIYTMLTLLREPDVFPEDRINELGVIEEQARFQDICLKPKRCCDIMLHARKGPYQSLMDRDDIRIKRVPTPIAWALAKELERRITFDDIYFAKAKDPFAPRWKVYDIKKPDGSINPDFKDIKLRFRASGALKNLYRHAFKVTDKMFTFRDVEVERRFWPEEYGYAPFALAVAPYYQSDKKWRGSWPEVIEQHILHWGFNSDARKYAGDDVHYTRRLHVEHFNSPEPGDDDSELAAMVAASRWRGFAVDLDKIRELKSVAFKKIKDTPIAPRQAKIYIQQVMDPIEKLGFQGSTKKVVLEDIAKNWMMDCDCNHSEICEKCRGTGEYKHPAAVRAEEVLDARKAGKEIELYDKLIRAGRFHASFRVIGTLSSRMSGGDGLNPQGIKHTKDVRAAFTLADFPLSVLSIGDFKSFEVSIAVAVFDDPVLNQELQSGKKIHALFACELYPEKTYEMILASDGSPVKDYYDDGKKGVFQVIYGGDENTLKNKLGIPIERGKPAFDGFMFKHPRVKAFGDEVYKDHACLKQPGGIGTAVEWHNPKEYAETLVGFKRYFTLEYRICKALYTLAQNPPQSIKSAKIKVIRRERIQTAGGAAQSALYGAAFNIMSAIVRQVKNHHIQSFGATITKAGQRSIWELQPVGINPWYVQPMNIHDEIACPTRPGYEDRVEQQIQNSVQSYRNQVPLLAIDWIKQASSWAGKKGEPDVTGSPRAVA